MDPHDKFVQKNRPRRGGNVYANQGSGDQIVHAAPPAKRGFGTDSKALLVILVVDVLFFFFGTLSYTGKNTSGDMWRAAIFLVLLATTGSIIRRWLRRRI